MFAYFESRIRPTELPPSAPPPGLIAFYRQFSRQSRALYAAMFATGLGVALIRRAGAEHQRRADRDRGLSVTR
jgi:ATP-binding cassette subfamily B multidrug efflux pump